MRWQTQEHCLADGKSISLVCSAILLPTSHGYSICGQGAKNPDRTEGKIFHFASRLAVATHNDLGKEDLSSRMYVRRDGMICFGAPLPVFAQRRRARASM